MARFGPANAHWAMLAFCPEDQGLQGMLATMLLPGGALAKPLIDSASAGMHFLKYDRRPNPTTVPGGGGTGLPISPLARAVLGSDPLMGYAEPGWAVAGALVTPLASG